jgi:phosphohistidine swiveling domain-containing protein
MAKFNYKKIEDMEWYQQGGATYPFYISNPYRCTQLFSPAFIHNKGHINTGYFNKKKERELADYYLNKQKKDSKFIKKWIKKWFRIAEGQNNLLKIIDQTRFSSFTDAQLSAFMKKLTKTNLEYWLQACLIEFYDPWGDIILKGELDKYPHIKLSVRDQIILTAPFKINYLQREKLDRRLLIKEIRKHPKLKTFIDKINKQAIIKDYPQFYGNLKRHVQKYFWINNTWFESIFSGRDFFIKEIKKDLRIFKKTKAQIKRIKRYEQDIKNKKSSVFRNRKIPHELRDVFNYFSILSDWRDIRKQYVLIYIHYLDGILDLLAARNSVNKELLKFTLFSEIKSWLLPKPFLKELKKRRQECLGYIDAGGSFQWQSKKVIKEVLRAINKSYKKRMKELSGMSTYPGRVKGKVKKIETIQEFKKMKQGDILVAKMTRPELMPIIRLASAIVTDEGGITCHAAIVSRELKIPCVVGTQMATKFLKNNDSVQVDATKGIIKKV